MALDMWTLWNKSFNHKCSNNKINGPKKGITKYRERNNELETIQKENNLTEHNTMKQNDKDYNGIETIEENEGVEKIAVYVF